MLLHSWLGEGGYYTALDSSTEGGSPVTHVWVERGLNAFPQSVAAPDLMNPAQAAAKVRSTTSTCAFFFCEIINSLMHISSALVDDNGDARVKPVQKEENTTTNG